MFAGSDRVPAGWRRTIASLVACLVFALAAAGSARASDNDPNSGLLTVDMNGSGNFVLKAFAQAGSDVAPVLRPNIGRTCPATQILSNGQNTTLGAYCQHFFALSSGDQCLDPLQTCTLTLTILAQPVRFPAVDASEQNYWGFGGWSGACAGQTTTTCTLQWGTCAQGACTYVDRDVGAKFTDLHTPTAQITDGPDQDEVLVSETGLTKFNFRSDEYKVTPSLSTPNLAEKSTFWCHVDSDDDHVCMAPPTATDDFAVQIPNSASGDGPHTLFVRAVDVSGQSSPVITRRWVQRFPPDTAITRTTRTEGDITKDQTLSVAFSAERRDGSLGYTCVLTRGVTALRNEACAATFTANALADGDYTFTVAALRSVDDRDIPETVPAQLHWTVDRTAPTVRITNGPNDGEPSAGNVSFAFETVGEPAATLVCTLDGKSQDCKDGSVAYRGLVPGAHQFSVRATDAAGNLSEPATRNWRVLADGDGDGFVAGVADKAQNDCDDRNPAINPVAKEVYNNAIDENCDGLVQSDADFDGHPTPGPDCNDNNAGINPGAADAFDDGVDQDCSGTPNEHPDADGDGFRGVTQDCDDGNSGINPNARDIPGNKVDEDCKNGPQSSLAPSVTFAFKYQLAGRWTKVKALQVTNVQKGWRITVACKGSKRCPFGSRTKRVRRNAARLSLGAWLTKSKRVPGGSRLEIRIVPSSTELAIRVKRWSIRNGRAPSLDTEFCVRDDGPQKC